MKTLKIKKPTQTEVIEQNFEQIKSMLKEGYTQTEIAEKFGIYTSFLSQQLKNYDLSMSIIREKVLERRISKRVESIKERLKQGAKLVEIANELGTAQPNISMYIKKYNLKKYAKNGIKRGGNLGAYKLLISHIPNINKMILEGKSIRDIARHYNVSSDTICRHITREYINNLKSQAK